MLTAKLTSGGKPRSNAHKSEGSTGQPIASKATLDTFKVGRRWRFVTDPGDGRADIGDVDVQRQFTTSHQVAGQCRYLVVG